MTDSGKTPQKLLAETRALAFLRDLRMRANQECMASGRGSCLQWIQDGAPRVPQIKHRDVSLGDPLVITDPSLGMLNLVGDAANDTLVSDRSDLGWLFSNVQVSSRKAPICNVLFLYCRFDESGNLSGYPLSLRELTRQACAHIGVIASELEKHISPSRDLEKRDDWPANIILTFNRNGRHFGCFFQNLFLQMQTGVTMPMAWIKLVPVSGELGNYPDTAALMEVTHIAFRNTWRSQLIQQVRAALRRV